MSYICILWPDLDPFSRDWMVDWLGIKLVILHNVLYSLALD